MKKPVLWDLRGNPTAAALGLHPGGGHMLGRYNFLLRAEVPSGTLAMHVQTASYLTNRGVLASLDLTTPDVPLARCARWVVAWERTLHFRKARTNALKAFVRRRGAHARFRSAAADVPLSVINIAAAPAANGHRHRYTASLRLLWINEMMPPPPETKVVDFRNGHTAADAGVKDAKASGIHELPGSFYNLTVMVPHRRSISVPTYTATYKAKAGRLCYFYVRTAAAPAGRCARMVRRCLKGLHFRKGLTARLTAYFLQQRRRKVAFFGPQKRPFTEIVVRRNGVVLMGKKFYECLVLFSWERGAP